MYRKSPYSGWFFSEHGVYTIKVMFPVNKSVIFMQSPASLTTSSTFYDLGMTLLGSGHNLLGVPWRFHWHLGLGFSTLHDSCPTHFPECQQPFWKPWEPLNITTWVAWFHHEMHTGIYMPRHANCSPFKIAGCGTHSTSTIQAWLESQSSEFVWTEVD